MNNAIDTSTNYTIDEIIDAFSHFDGSYRRAQVDAALAMRAEITPRLIELLEAVHREPDRIVDDGEFTGHVYAAMLLAYWRETRAHRLIVKLLSLRKDLLDALWGDMITEDLPTLLYRTCGGDLEEIKALVENREANEFVRGSAAGALAYAVVDGAAPREEILAFFGSLLHPDAAPSGSLFWELLIVTACDLYPKEILPQIRRACADDLMENNLISIEDIESILREDPEEGIHRLRKEMQRRMPDDFHGAMDWWAMFREQPAGKPAGTATAMAPSLRSLAQGTQNAENLTRQQRRKREREVVKQTKKRKGKRR